MKYIWIRQLFYCLITIFLLSGNSNAITILEEKKLAQEFMAMVKSREVILEDPIVNDMVNKVGQHLLTSIKNQPFKFTFYVVNDDVFNAFAAPGANIFFYRGLITSLDNIDEFAGIVGHEIAHAVSRHVSESIDRSKYLNIGTLAAVLAGAVIGSQTDGETGTAIIQGSLALSTTAMLAFTRENETEADEKGIMFLKNSCFSPEGLMGGLMKIRRADYKGIEAIPEYVKTHPGTGNRIAHTESILSGYTEPEDKPVCNEDFRFEMVKYRLLGLYSDIDTSLKKLLIKEKENPNSAELHYGLGLLYDRKFKPDLAMVHLKKALSINIFDPLILLELGRLNLAEGSLDKALQILDSIDSDPVVGLMATFYQASTLLEMRRLSEAKNGFNEVINKIPNTFPQAYLKLANIYSIEKQNGLSAYNLGIYYSKIKKDATAVVHLKRAMEQLENGPKKDKAKKLLDQLKEKISKAKKQAN